MQFVADSLLSITQWPWTYLARKHVFWLHSLDSEPLMSMDGLSTERCCSNLLGFVQALLRRFALHSCSRVRLDEHVDLLGSAGTCTTGTWQRSWGGVVLFSIGWLRLFSGSNMCGVPVDCFKVGHVSQHHQTSQCEFCISFCGGL